MSGFSAEGATPSMAQWFSLKEEYPEFLLFFRMGDFYEMFFDDAKTAAAALDIALTARGEHQGKPIAMCGVPVATAETYLAKLIRRGFRVAVAEQTEDPKNRPKGAKGPVGRAVVRLMTPGTLTEEALLVANRANLLLALYQENGLTGAAWLDISTGSFWTEKLADPQLGSLLSRLCPAEILCPENTDLKEFQSVWTKIAHQPGETAANRLLADTFRVADLSAFGEFSKHERIAAAVVLDYVLKTQVGKLPRLSPPERIAETDTLIMDRATRQSLELLTGADGEEKFSLFWAVKQTVTPAGGRLLSHLLSTPSRNPQVIKARQSLWMYLFPEAVLLDEIRTVLRGTPDMARALGRISLGRGSPRDLAAIRDTLLKARQIQALLPDSLLPDLLTQIKNTLNPAPELTEKLLAALEDPAPLRLGEAPAVKSSFDEELARWRTLTRDTRQIIASLEQRYARNLNIPGLKIRHLTQLGYLVEVPQAYAETVRQHSDFIFRQTLTNSARFTCVELSDLDMQINNAAGKVIECETALINTLCRDILDRHKELSQTAEALALLDVAQSACSLMQTGKWSCPELTDRPVLTVQKGRHPVIEASSPPGTDFMANDCHLDPAARLMLLTGPNMAGKSTYLRQNALIVILAQAGLPVPAEKVTLGPADRLFSRVGASDELSKGRSTFMVEMLETAAILNRAGPESFIIIDEIGRGTATLDGLAIAWAVLETLHNTLKSRTIFATHFHELTQTEKELPGVFSACMRVKETRQDIVFLHEVAKGAIGRSFGTHVAKLAGMPASVVERAENILKLLEKRGIETSEISLPLFRQPAPVKDPLKEDESQNFTSQQKLSPSLTKLMLLIEQTVLDQVTPKDALDLLYELKSLLEGVPECL